MYHYENSMTPDTLEEARRASTWMLIMMWRRGLFEVQYAGMTEEAIVAALRARKDGYQGGMPVGAVLSSGEAWARWWAGERAYVIPRGVEIDVASRLGEVASAGRGEVASGSGPERARAAAAAAEAARAAGAVPPIAAVRRRGFELDVRCEPLFVEIDSSTSGFSAHELHMETVGKIISSTGDDLGVMPHASGLNSMRRNGIVAISRGCDERGRDQTNTKKAVNHRGKGGNCVVDIFYDDATSGTDNGALLMGRGMVRIESLRSLMATRLPALACVRLFSDVAPDDPLRVKLYDQDKERLLRVQGVERAQQVVKLLESADDKVDGPSAEQMEQAHGILIKARSKLRDAVRRAQHATLETKRFELYQRHLRQIDRPLTDDEKRALCTVCNWRSTTLT